MFREVVAACCLLTSGRMTIRTISLVSSLAGAVAFAGCVADGDGPLPTDQRHAYVAATCGNGVVDPGEHCLTPPVLVAGVPAGIAMTAVEAGTFDADARADVAGAGAGAGQGRLRARRGDGTGGFPYSFSWYDTDTEFTDLAMFDMDGDGLEDMVIASEDDDAVHVRLHTGTLWAGPTIVSVGDQPRRVHASDLDGNGLGDFVSLDAGANAFSVVMQTAPGVYAAPTTYPAYGAESFSLADCDGNAADDIVFPILHGSSARLVALRNHGSGVFGNPRASGLNIPDDAPARGIATGDTNGDGLVDAVVTANESWTIATVGDGTCRFHVASRNQTYAWTFRPELADIDQDGDLDVIAPHGNDVDNTISIKYGNGNGTFAADDDVYQSPVLDWANETATADFNGDGALDLAIASNPGIFVMLSAP